MAISCGLLSGVTPVDGNADGSAAWLGPGAGDG